MYSQFMSVSQVPYCPSTITKRSTFRQDAGTIASSRPCEHFDGHSLAFLLPLYFTLSFGIRFLPPVFPPDNFLSHSTSVTCQPSALMQQLLFEIPYRLYPVLIQSDVPITMLCTQTDYDAAELFTCSHENLQAHVASVE